MAARRPRRGKGGSITVRSAEPGFALAVLRSCALFRDVDDDALALVGASLRMRRFRRNEVIFHAGDPGDSLFIVESGSVKIVLASPEGEEAIIATLHRGDFFGELAVLDGAARSASAVAFEPTDVYTLSRVPFMRLVDEQPALRTALLASVAAELRRLTRHVEELHFLDLPGRLATRLVELAREADPTGREVRLSWPYTQSELASMIGGTRQSVNRLLSGLSEEGLLRIEPEAIVIPDVERLARVAER
jgi:CRP/FNR family transcriptional regulator/CRP/FNR family cyclic AMP-dependent transcriptional regulator